MTAGGTLCRLEYLGRNGWAVGHAGVALLDPARYVERLEANGKFGRATELDDRLQPTGRVWEPANLPDPATLVPSETRIPRLPTDKDKRCEYCETVHAAPWDGACLL